MEQQPPPPVGFPVVGMIGGGQLARMTQQSAIGLGIGFSVLAARSDDSAARVTPGTMIGDPDDPAAAVAFARTCDVITFDHEQVAPSVLAALTEADAVLRPGPGALRFAQDKIEMRQKLSAAGIPCPGWLAWTPDMTPEQAGEQLGWPLVVKTSRGGYDGRGVWVVENPDELTQVLAESLPPEANWLLEEYVPFTAELSAQVARSASGQAVAYPVVRTVQTEGICTEVVCPAPGLPDDVAVAAQDLALQVAGLLEVVGMLAVELFLTERGVLVNELAMRPHNSGHWSIDGATASQFDNHLRAVLDLPLGSPQRLAPWVVMVNVLGGEEPDMYRAYRHVMARDPDLNVHMYGKQVRPGRKIGHVTLLGDDLDDVLARAHHAADYLTGTIDE